MRRKTASPKRRDPSGVLTDKQAAYVENRAYGIGKEASARMASYGRHAAQEARDLEKLPTVRAALDREFAANAKLAGLTRQDVIDGLKDAIDQAKVIADPSAQIAGWREIAKILGFYAPEVRKIQLSSDQSKLMSRLESMDDAELLSLMETPVYEGEFQEVH